MKHVVNGIPDNAVTAPLSRLCSAVMRIFFDPKRIDARVIWDIRQLDVAFESLPSEVDDAQNPWDAP
jgi:hypothetical protein